MSDFIDWTIRYGNLPLYICVTLDRLKDARGIRVLVQERVDGTKGAMVGFYIPENTALTAQMRRDMLKHAIEDTVRAVDELFADCDKPECPNCQGKKVKVT